MVETEQEEKVEFQWGKRKGIGGKKKDVSFYESFTYDGVEYFLYDSVYLYKEGEPEPYIGKILKIWQNPDKTKKVKILWFFRPCEILNYLGAEDTRDNELFLASGDGVGLANVNSLEVIAGKCSVLCYSNDSRNPRPSDEALKKADFVFCRTFDVGKLEVCNEICEKIAGVEVKFLLNKVDTSKYVKRAEKDGKDAIVNTESEDLFERNTSNGESTLKTKDSTVEMSTKENVDLKASLSIEKSSNEEKSGVCVSDGGNGMANTSSKHKNILDDKVSSKLKIDYNKTPGKDALPKDVEGRVKSPRDSSEVEHRPEKKAKLDSFVQLSLGKTKSDIQKPGLNRSNGDTLASSPKIHVSENASRTKNVKDSHGTKDSLIKKPKLDEKPTKVSIGKNLKPSVADCKIDGQIVEVTRRPDADRSRWFKGLPWEERMKNAHEQRTLVLIQNFDPAYTSGEVEDIVWHAFNESCTAKMIQRTANSMPHIGQAYIVFKTKEAAEKVVRKLDEGCLLLANGNALFGSFATPHLQLKKQTYFGHHSIDKLRHLMQREMKEAVSTSHCSQPNTVEYDMAMEWCLLQERSQLTWKKLFKQQEEELRKFKSKLKFR
ncbi:protein ANTI-SILENCING 1-like isoform X1 [Cucurbita maxima]|uniref:Protein ANTI-SILENCING 1-like isoform X1 n=1 Tax=Cucurbita maxima TaxID=3661 RepID=A0A6J1J1L4_CUCMA|nr:protein ANTI-SILENCING 1-like isoform X1 [Cucurbita maxima]XP_022982081.1 protein ANTI-SILENCING 1-like isoform X1 [Cucurbita maxima]XP_022982082.1 protein ANTI-SILENCING 1-like isoform X1 [Cucurbita maxima]